MWPRAGSQNRIGPAMHEVRRREPLNYADPNMEPARFDPGHAWIICSFAFLFLVGEIASLIVSLVSMKRGLIPLYFCLFAFAAIVASLLGLVGLRFARLSGSIGARTFAIFILVGTALGLGGMLAIIFVGGS